VLAPWACGVQKQYASARVAALARLGSRLVCLAPLPPPSTGEITVEINAELTKSAPAQKAGATQKATAQPAAAKK
jgi:hypothetical protein